LETKYKFYPRHKKFKTKVLGHEFIAPDSASFRSSYEDIFLKEIYKFQGKNSKPIIIDLGANIGLSTIYFKYLYPEAKVLALEADPEIFRYLELNVAKRAFSGVELLNKAAWKEDTSFHFHSRR